MQNKFDYYKSLCAEYDRGRLVPFIGSGMSIPACADWDGLVESLENECQINNRTPKGDPIQRAFFALQVLRREGRNIACVIRRTLYTSYGKEIPEQSRALAKVSWPLICTTNYDDIYLRARLPVLRSLPNRPKDARIPLRGFGRSETGCRRILQHLSLPDGEVIWALQGVLTSSDPEIAKVWGADSDREELEQELVVGHAEYRKAAHRAPHFRRCFAELFRTRSLLFLGSGLAESYFRSLFDEIIELTGPPMRPHFAVIEEGHLDPEFMRQQYHIICNTYPKGEHGYVTTMLSEFADFLKQNRTRPSVWSFRVASPQCVNRTHSIGQFNVVRAGPPDPKNLQDDEVVAISCGREQSEREPRRGDPKPSCTWAKMIGLTNCEHQWEDDWIVKWTSLGKSFGIVARGLIEDDVKDESSRDRRNPDAIRKAFHAFLSCMELRRVRLAHVQLLSAGRQRVFETWVSLAQMSRAYGQWFRGQTAIDLDDAMRVNVYIVDPDLVARLQGGYIGLAEELEDAPLHIEIEIIDALGRADRQHQIVKADAKLSDLTGTRFGKRPHLYAHPIPRLDSSCNDDMNQSVREFGLVSGSTLIIDYRTPAPSAGIPRRLR